MSTGTYSTTKSSMDASSSRTRTLVITLSTVLSVVAFLSLFIGVVLCYRCRHGRMPFSARGITPIDDEEIESWKLNRADEKAAGMDTKYGSTGSGSIRKPPSVIVYQNLSPRSASFDNSSPLFSYKRSLDIPQTPVFARAPNSRPGLTDDAIVGDEAFVLSPKRHPSRLSKLPPYTPRHARTRSSRSSISGNSYRDQWYSHYTDGEPSPRTSNEFSYARSSQSQDTRHKRIFSNSSNPPRLSFDDEVFLGGLSPRPLLRRSDFTPESEIGRAIG